MSFQRIEQIDKTAIGIDADLSNEIVERPVLKQREFYLKKVQILKNMN